MISSDDQLELDRGILVRMPPAGALHGTLASLITRLVDEHVEAEELGVVCGADTGFVLARKPDIVRAPDASFVAGACPQAVRHQGAPDLAVEVVSPSDRIDNLDKKIEEYFAAGTRLVWVLHPRTRSVHVYRSPTDSFALGENDELSGGDVLPGFRCAVRRCFA